MTKAFSTSTLNSEPDRDDEVVKRFQRVHYWPLADLARHPTRVLDAHQSGRQRAPRTCEFMGLADLDIYRARFLLIAAMDAQWCGASWFRRRPRRSANPRKAF
jgi:hypothetical protein